MAGLPSMRISAKLPMVVVGGAMVVGLGIGISSYLTAENSMETQAQRHLEISAERARDELSTFMHHVERDLHLVATNPVTAQALAGVRRAWSMLDAPTQELQDAYIENNPHPIGQKDQLVQATSGQMYDSIHATFHPWFQNLAQQHGYYDVFLFDGDGNLVYSVFKELDFATNFAANAGGQWASSNLGTAYRAAMAAPASNPSAFEDFEPYCPSYNAPACFIAHPVHDGSGNTVGVLAYQVPADVIDGVFADVAGLGETGEIALIGEDGYLRNDSTKTPNVSDPLNTQFDATLMAEALQQGAASGTGRFYRDEPMQAEVIAFEIAGTPFAVAAMKSVSETMAPVVSIRNRMAVTGGLLLLAVAGVGALFARSITKPITELVGEMRTLSSGDTNIALNGKDRQDEIGDMSRTVAVFRDGIIERERLEGESAAAAEQRLQRQQQIDTLITGFRDDVGAVIAAVGDNAGAMTNAASTLEKVANDTDQQAEMAANASQEASASVDAVAAAAEELAASISEIGRQVEKTKEVVSTAANRANETNHQVEQLSSTADAIGNVIALIQDIAEQTNLLALNATIEAARAGEAGKGFAVVASEVKNLASQTAKATDDISTQITEIQSSTTEAVGAIQQISGTMEEVNTYMASIASSVEEQSAATGEISSNVAQAATGTKRVVDSIAVVTDATTQTTSAADDVGSASGKVTDQTARLSQTVERFLDGVAAA
ncbi:MAG: methyl-accepting chemotaxis protein [Cohaesibacteraceae bacterium]